MANKRNYEWALASVIDGFFTQDKAGGVTQRVPFSLIVSSIQGQNVFQPKGDDLTAIEAISGTGVLTRTGTNTWAVVSSVAPTAHASTHQAGGGDALAGQSIPGLQVTDNVGFSGLQLRTASTVADLGFLNTTATLRMIWRWNDTNDRLELITRNDDGSSRATRIQIPRSSSLPTSIFGALSVSSDASFGTYVDAVDSFRINGVSAITSARAGRLTGLRLTNLTTGQIPVCSDENSEITASGLTDDGTHFSASRILRSFNSLTRSGNVWTAIQRTQDAQERVSILSSDGSGVGAYHSIMLVPADAEASGRGLGTLQWCQRVAGKSGLNPGAKAEILVDSIGSGGSVGGFGAKIKIRYRPDNGNDQVDALRIGAFGGSTADAVETAILLRANAGLNIQGLGSAGALVANSAGAVSVVGAPGYTMFAAQAPDLVRDYGVRSVLGQSATRRKIAANTVVSGDELELVWDFRGNMDGASIVIRAHIGPDGNYSSPYDAIIAGHSDLGPAGASREVRLRIAYKLFDILGTVVARGRVTIESTEATGSPAPQVRPYPTESVVTLATIQFQWARNTDAFIDLTAQLNSSNTSTFDVATVAATCRKAF